MGRSSRISRSSGFPAYRIGVQQEAPDAVNARMTTWLTAKGLAVA